MARPIISVWTGLLRRPRCLGRRANVSILGTEGYIEMRKYIDIARDDEGDQVYLSNNEGTFHYSVKGKIGFPFFGELIHIVSTEQKMP